jgi:hypothetical protein
LGASSLSFAAVKNTSKNIGLMQVSYTCPACQQVARAALANDVSEFGCSHCRQPIRVPAGAISGGQIHRCLVCPSTELYARKDFPQRLGVALVIAGIIGSSIARANYQVFWTFAILFATALIDLIL